MGDAAHNASADSGFFSSLVLDDQGFRRLCALLYRETGIALNEGKRNLVASRLGERIRERSMGTLAEYVQYLEHAGDRAELNWAIDTLTTNKTSFFRHQEQFDYLRGVLQTAFARGGPVRVWSAGCSSGQEPYSIAMMAASLGPGHDFKVLATDLSRTVLNSAKAGVYSPEELGGIPEAYRSRYLAPVDGPTPTFRVDNRVRARISFAQLNLQHDWPMQGPFDVILCRNVMIYFDDIVRRRLYARFCGLLRPSGSFILGATEALPKDVPGYRGVHPSIYEKAEGGT